MYSRFNRWLAKTLATLTRLVQSRQFFWIIVAVFVFESVWVAFSAVYPMAFDEDFHFGIIQFYAHHLSPFINTQPADTYAYGALARDPSYLYQYLMSFPYRLISTLTHSVTSQIISLRIINIGIFVAAIYSFKRLFTKFSSLSPVLINLVLLFFIMTPLLPQMAGQINYDGLFILAIALSLYLFFDFSKSLQTAGQINLKKGLLLVNAGLLGSLVKYAYLPILAVLVIATLFNLFKRPGGLKKLGSDIKQGFTALSWTLRGALVGLTLLSLGLFGQRYGVNLVRYHTPAPQCNQVLSITDCQQYSPWLRNYQMSLNKDQGTDVGILSYTDYWFNHALFGMTFAANGRTSGYGFGDPLPVITIIFRGLFLGGLVAILLFGWRLLWDKPINRLLAAISLAYLGALWFQNFDAYQHLGWPVAVQGRYWIPVLIPLLILFGQLLAAALKQYRVTSVIVATAFVALILQGGGLTTFILQSDSSWYWPNTTVTKVNQVSRDLLRHVVID